MAYTHTSLYWHSYYSESDAERGGHTGMRRADLQPQDVQIWKEDVTNVVRKLVMIQSCMYIHESGLHVQCH